MNNILLSYIVPVYNTGPWLEECFHSIAESYCNLCEIIIIDDGSEDNSSEIISRFVNTDVRFKCIRQKNKGLSSARNAGLKIAQGKYVMFVDSDDCVNSQNILNMLEIALEEDADVIAGRILCIDESGKYYNWGKFLDFSTFPDGVLYLQAIHMRATYFPMVFGYMIKRELIESNNLRFIDGLVHEDELWTPVLLLKSKKTIAVEINHYIYRIQRRGSITSANNSFIKLFSLSTIICSLINEYLQSLLIFEKTVVAAHFFKWRINSLYSICVGMENVVPKSIFNLMKDFLWGNISYFNFETKNIDHE